MPSTVTTRVERLRPAFARITVALVAVGVTAAGCSAKSKPSAAREASTTTTTVAPASATTTSSAPTTTTTPKPLFPSIVVEAMAQFVPLPAGAEAPARLPPFTGYVTAQTGGLGGEANTTLIATPRPVAVNSPELSSSGGSELASFSTTPTASVSNAQSSLARQKSQSIAACGGPSQTVSLSNGVQATTCPSLDGATVNWLSAGWQFQVLTLDGTNPSTAEASQIARTIAASGLPSSAGGGIVTVEVPANASVGTLDTAALAWTLGADFFQVRSTDNPTDAIEVAAAMRPYPR